MGVRRGAPPGDPGIAPAAPGTGVVTGRSRAPSTHETGAADMKVKDHMSTPAVTVPTLVSAQDAARQMDFAGVGCLVVVDAERMVGIVTDRDIALRVLAADLPPDTPIDQVMTRDVISVSADDDVNTALAVFRSHAVRRLPALTGGTVAGVITVDDLLRHAQRVLSALLGPVAGEIAEPRHAVRATGGTGPPTG